MKINDMTKHLKPGAGRGPTMQQVPPGTPINIDLKHATQHVCDCGCKHFIPGVKLYTVSAIISPTGQELLAQQPALVCMSCHKAYGEKTETEA